MILARGFRSDYPRIVTRRWREAVRHHGGVNEEASSGSADMHRNLYRRYGTTLLVAVAISGKLLLAQLGDGDIVLFRPSGDIEQPLVGEDKLVGSETFSLCSPDADKLWQTTTRDIGEVQFVTLSTDGLINAYADQAAFHRLLKAARDNIERFGIREASAILPERLDDFSAKGSGDDITLVGLLIGAANTSALVEETDTVRQATDTSIETGNSGDATRSIDRVDCERPNAGAVRETAGSDAAGPVQQREGTDECADGSTSGRSGDGVGTGQRTGGITGGAIESTGD